jgi:hypothetical protein
MKYAKSITPKKIKQKIEETEKLIENSVQKLQSNGTIIDDKSLINGPYRSG